MRYLIGVDIGTSATKTVLFDEGCQVIQTASQEYPLVQPQNGWAEQEPLDWYSAVMTTIKRVVRESGVAAADIKGIGLSGQMHQMPVACSCLMYRAAAGRRKYWKSLISIRNCCQRSMNHQRLLVRSARSLLPEQVYQLIR